MATKRAPKYMEPSARNLLYHSLEGVIRKFREGHKRAVVYTSEIYDRADMLDRGYSLMIIADTPSEDVV